MFLSRLRVKCAYGVSWGGFPHSDPVYRDLAYSLESNGACSGGKFVVSRAGGAYNARDGGPYRKSVLRLGDEKCVPCDCFLYCCRSLRVYWLQTAHSAVHGNSTPRKDTSLRLYPKALSCTSQQTPKTLNLARKVSMKRISHSRVATRRSLTARSTQSLAIPIAIRFLSNA